MSEKKSLTAKSEDEIELSELFRAMLADKWIIIGSSFALTVLALIYALLQPNIYTSEALLAPAEQEQSLNGIQGQLGGIASLAGINIGGRTSNKTELAVKILRSRHFTREFITKHEILPDLMAAIQWNQETNSLVYDETLYNAAKNEWVGNSESDEDSVPSMQEAYKVFSSQIFIDVDSTSGMVTISAEHLSPYVAQKWVTWLVEDINNTMKNRDMEEAEKSEMFLTSQLGQIQIADIREVLYRLIEEQAKTKMFANIRDEYVFKTIDPAIVPEQRTSPKRTLICIAGFLSGGVFGVFIAVVRFFSKNS